MDQRVDSLKRLSVQGDTVRILQITDMHLTAYPGGKLLGLDTDYSLKAVLDLIKDERGVADLVLATGDLADAGVAGAYRRAIDYFSQVATNQAWLPGNHDDVDVMREIGGQERTAGEIRVGNWQILLLNSQVPGEVDGRLGEAELARLENALANGAEENLHSLVCLHHHPISIGCDWLDQQIVEDADSFFEVIDRFPNVRCILWGHVHQEVHTTRGAIDLLCAPSTCIQFLPKQVDFALDSKPPGYRWLDLHADGSFETGVSRAERGVFPVDREAGGYL
ncbi:MAG: 3',5'-cyclic-AMP phosphodiesterase [Pseudomonadota bacterium]